MRDTEQTHAECDDLRRLLNDAVTQSLETERMLMHLIANVQWVAERARQMQDQIKGTPRTVFRNEGDT